MASIRQIVKKTANYGHNSLVAIATVGMVFAFSPATAHANGAQHISSNVSGITQGSSTQLQEVQFRGRGFRGSRGGFRTGSFGNFRSSRGRSFRGRGFRGRGFRGGSFAAGLVTGAILSSSAKHYHGHSSSRFSADYIAACSRKYRSFNPRTGLYLAYSGKYRRCKI